MKRMMWLAVVVACFGAAPASARPNNPKKILAGAYVDAAEFGFRPDASAAENAAALQKAVDGGRKTVHVVRPGIYDLDRSVTLDSDTTLFCEPGVVFRKAAKYLHVLVNRAAYSGGCDSNIVVRGLEIRTAGNETFAAFDTLAPGFRGHLAFFRVKDCGIYDFTLNDLGRSQYAIQVVDFDGFTVDGFVIRGDKDGVHFNAGKNFVVRNGRLRTYDDGIALNAGDWPYCTPKMGPLVNGVIENIVDEPGGHCNFARVITACWKDWYPGIRVQRDDLFRFGKSVYFVHPMPLSTNEYVSLTAPTHRKGVWKSPEGINWVFLQDDGETRADIRNVVFRNIEMNSARAISCSWELCEWARLVHPEIAPKDYPVIDIRLENVRQTVHGTIVGGNASCKVTMKNCTAAGHLAYMGRSVSTWGTPYPTKRTFTVSNCAVTGDKAAFVFNDPDGEAEVRVKSGPKPSVIGGVCK